VTDPDFVLKKLAVVETCVRELRQLARPDALVDINDLAELSQIRLDGDTLVVGALARHNDLLGSAVAGEHFPIFIDAERVIADPVVRNFGTVGGSLCQADPSEDLAAAFAAVSATAVLRGPAGTRDVPVRELHVGPYETVIAPDEILLELRVPIRPGGGSAYEKVERRVGDYPVAAAGAVLWLDNDTVVDAGIGLTAVGAAHFAAPEAESALRGAPATEESFAAAARIAAQHCNPAADQRGPVDYKRHLAAELTTRALRRAAARARGQEA
jgi:carbon-monoxide dehydrogenase medium subunit